MRCDRNCAGRRRAAASGLATAAVWLIATLAPGAAVAAPGAITSVLTGQTVSGQPIGCTTQSDGVRVCDGDYATRADTRLRSFDSTPLALYVILPPAPAAGTPDGPYPLVVQSHGWGSSASGPANTEYYGPTGDQWARDGYAVLELTARGFGDSCGSEASRLADPSGCQNGYIRLDDDRYEVRDVQYAVGLLVDEGIADPARIGVTGESYGGGVSLALATLKDRVMNADGMLRQWRSPDGTPLSIAAAAPVIPWSDLVESLVPNGRTLDYRITGPTDDLSPIGVEKQSFVAGLYAEGSGSGYYARADTNSQADLTTWFAALNAGEPYDTNSEDQSIIAQIARYHSSYYLLDGAYGTAREAPSPLLVANGFTDDLFPVDEALRYYNLERSLYPNDPFALFDFDGGHMRGQNKPADRALLSQRIQAFFDHYVKGTGATPQLGATALTQTCPASAPSGGPYWAPTWAGLHPGEVDLSSAAAQTISSSAGDPTIAKTFDPIAGGGACATATATDQGAGVASYRLAAATGDGYTLLGAPTVTAKLAPGGQYPLIAARLLDVDPATNTETLVARGLYRVTSGGVQTFQLHPGAWHFAAGQIPKLELLGQDPPYARTSNGQFTISVSDLELQLPVHEAPGTSPVVQAPHPPPTGGSGPGGVGGPGGHRGRPGGSRARCTARPSARILRRGTHLSTRRLSVAGTASELRCRGAARRRERVRRVLVSVYRSVGHGRCRFVLADGHLSRARRCSRTLPLRARGTSHWRLRRRLRIPRGVYTIRVRATDGAGHRSRLYARGSSLRLRAR
ncbi:MAG: CocE/NonD family hydrolase [Solirubrobacteraceae bacterium]